MAVESAGDPPHKAGLCCLGAEEGQAARASKCFA